MKYDHDQSLLIKAQLGDLLDTLRTTLYDANPVQFLLRLELLREQAARQGLGAIAEIAATFEAALQHAGQRGGSTIVSDNFIAILDDAIGVSDVHPNASEALLASVALRLGR